MATLSNSAGSAHGHGLANVKVHVGSGADGSGTAVKLRCGACWRTGRTSSSETLGHPARRVVVGEGYKRKALGAGSEHDLGFRPGESAAKAVVDASLERERSGVGPRDVERIGVVGDGWVSVGCDDQCDDRSPGRLVASPNCFSFSARRRTIVRDGS